MNDINLKPQMFWNLTRYLWKVLDSGREFIGLEAQVGNRSPTGLLEVPSPPTLCPMRAQTCQLCGLQLATAHQSHRDSARVTLPVTYSRHLCLLLMLQVILGNGRGQKRRVEIWI